ncbi:hypothetical protein [Ponticaulis profundi]|uniref:Glycoside hydrolase family 19 catalytic domain-containing protein n=1 Tax=Ponticaulis profundi TaxID=2665222 RepID=A0ABW1SCA5_9PROT
MISLEGIPFGLIGLAIAVLDFTGTSKKIEAALARYIEVEKQDAVEAKAQLLTTDLAYHWHAFRSFVPGALIGIGFFTGLWFWLGENNKLLWLIDWLPNWPWWSFVYWGPLLLVILYILDHLTIEGFRFGISVIIWRMFWILSLPKSGIVGSIGLIIAIADNLL